MDKCMKCPKCGGQMEEGYQHDSTNMLDTITKRTKWVRGGKSLGKNKSTFDLGNIAFNTNRQQIPITIYRCVSCGLLESYAK